jgi:Cu2+-exporting ATPase
MPPACFHCGLPVAEPGRWRASLLGEAREFCCGGCRAVAETIAAGGLARYYETRTELPAPPPAPAPGGLAVYDEPAALREFAADAAEGEGALEATFLIEQVRCPACLWLVEQALCRQPGVLRAHVNFAAHRAQLAWDPRVTRPSALIGALRSLGYDAQPFDPRRQHAARRAGRRADLWRLFVAGFGAMQVMMYAFPAYLDAGAGTLSPESEALMRWASLLLTLPVILISCVPFFSGAWRELRRRRPGMDTPIALGIAAGFAASAWATVTGEGAVYFDSISMLVFLLLGARWLEAAARARATRALDRLARWAPDFALRLDAGAAVRVAAHALAPGDRVLVGAGERVPADGIVESGHSSVDEALLTGEPLPVACAPGSALTGGSTNLGQPLVMRVLRAGAETRAAAIARLVERGAASRPRLVEGANAIAELLTYVVLAVALAAGLYWHSIWIVAAVLVIACPCALALAAPVALATATGRLATRGIALANAGTLETLARATDVVLDKTGTLTEGRFSIAAVDALGPLDQAACLALARRLEAGSRHPLARAFEGRSEALPAADLREFAGRGIEGSVDGRRMRIGTPAFCEELAHRRAPAAAGGALTQVWLAGEDGYLATFSLRDALRPGSAGAVETLRAAGLRVHLLSGDAPAAVRDVAKTLGIDTAVGGASPEEKFAYVERLQRQGRVVVMAGDGINDAPVLARADVSAAMAGGADLAQRQADLIVLGNSPAALAEAFGIARRAMRIVRQNFAWALGYNALALPLAAAGWVGPWEAAVGMAASSFIVVLNALRLEPAAMRNSPWKASTSSSLSPSQSYS